MRHELRLATASDLPAIAALIEAAYRPWVALIGQEPAPLSQDHSAMVARGQVTLALNGATAEGLLILIDQGDVLLIENVAVAPGAQGSGLGRRLMQEAETRAGGLRALQLYTHQKMAANLRFYQRLGFVETHRITEHGLPRVYLEKPLHPIR
jgi:ribosomal protein S18 acetylase RimI-like enzyme